MRVHTTPEVYVLAVEPAHTVARSLVSAKRQGAFQNEAGGRT